MEWWSWLCFGVLAVVAADRLGVWAEARGWIYWRKRTRGSMSDAGFGPLFEAFQPAYHCVVEERDRRRLEIHQSGRGEPVKNDTVRLP